MRVVCLCSLSVFLLSLSSPPFGSCFIQFPDLLQPILFSLEEPIQQLKDFLKTAENTDIPVLVGYIANLTERTFELNWLSCPDGSVRKFQNCMKSVNQVKDVYAQKYDLEPENYCDLLQGEYYCGKHVLKNCTSKWMTEKTLDLVNMVLGPILTQLGCDESVVMDDVQFTEAIAEARIRGLIDHESSAESSTHKSVGPASSMIFALLQDAYVYVGSIFML